MRHSPVPGESVAGYDVSDRLDTDYYAVFADVAGDDRAVWDRAKGFVDEVLPRMDGLWAVSYTHLTLPTNREV